MYLELLLDAILTHWKRPEIDIQNIKLDENNMFQGYSEAGFRYFY